MFSQLGKKFQENAPGGWNKQWPCETTQCPGVYVNNSQFQVIFTGASPLAKITHNDHRSQSGL